MNKIGFVQSRFIFFGQSVLKCPGLERILFTMAFRACVQLCFNVTGIEYATFINKLSVVIVDFIIYNIHTYIYK